MELFAYEVAIKKEIEMKSHGGCGISEIQEIEIYFYCGGKL